MKAVLASIKPRFCELIASGDKQFEFRKSAPKLPVPFKVFIYCTQDDTPFILPKYSSGEVGNGKVIGEFICDDITSYRMCMGIPQHLVIEGCISADEIWKYCNKGQNDIYAWHISDLVMYDKPRELSSFYEKCNVKICGNDCEYFRLKPVKTEYTYYCDCGGWLPITRPPQSWRYVETIST